MALCLTQSVHAQLSWKIFGTLREGRADCQVVCIGKGQALVIGGYNAGGSPVPSCELLDVNLQTITDAAPMNVARAEFVALLAPDSSVIAVSGDMTGDPNWGELTPTVERYDRATRRWRVIGSLKTARYQHVAGFISDHEILVVGGRHANLSSMKDAEIFDVTTGTSTTVANYPFVVSTPVMGVSSTGDVLVFAGRDGGTNGYRERNVYRYNRSNNSWSKAGTIADPIQLPEILKLWDGRLAIAGGSQQESPLDFSRDVQIENSGTWSTLARMQRERQWFAMEQWSADTIMTLGGYDNTGASLNSMDWINVATGASTPGPLLIYQHQHCRAVSIPSSFDVNGKPRTAIILVVSGRMNGGKITPVVEVLEGPPCIEVASAGEDQSICRGDSIRLTATGGPTVHWSPPDGLSCVDCVNPVASPQTTTTYIATVSSGGGCTASDTVIVTVNPLPVINAGGDTTICITETIELHASGGVTYHWSPADGLSCTDCADPVASPHTTTTYTVVGTGVGGCTAQDQVMVTVEGTKIAAHIERGYHLLPGTSVPVRVILDEPLGAGINQLFFTLNYEREMLRLGGILMTGTQLEGWTRTTLVDTIGGISLMFTPPPGGSTINGGVLLWLELQGYVGDSTISELPFSISVPNQHCMGIAASPGRIQMDSICGLSYRLIERDFSVLKPVAPNPSSSDATIEFELGLDGPVRLEVVDAAGVQVEMLVDEYMKVGSYSIQWDSGELSSALYYVRFIAGGWVQTQRVMLEK
jgi:N-acetylneuraminic acid mutarotase